MVFSFFKKKEQQAEEKMPERAAVRPKPLVAPTASQPAVGPVSKQPAPVENKPKPVPTVTFQGAMPVAGAAPQKDPKSVPDKKTVFAEPLKPNKSAVDSNIDSLGLSDTVVTAFGADNAEDPVQSDIEQLAFLYANGQDVAVASFLESSLHSYPGREGLRIWAFYFDFLQLTGDRALFDKKCLEFASLCETSPPTWKEPVVATKPAGPAVSSFELNGILTGENGKVLTPILAAIEKKEPVRLVCAKLAGVDDEIAGALANILRQARLRAVPFALEGAERVKNSLRSRVVTGKPEHPESWQLAFELLQCFGTQEEFEEKALDYAITFEQSPPSWEPAKVTSLPANAQPLDAAYHFSGDIRSSKFDELKSVLQEQFEPVLDFSAVKRLDFFSAGQLANHLASHKKSVGREVTIRHPNKLVLELMGVVGINKVARILVSKS